MYDKVEKAKMTVKLESCVFDDIEAQSVELLKEINLIYDLIYSKRSILLGTSDMEENFSKIVEEKNASPNSWTGRIHASQLNNLKKLIEIKEIIETI